VKDLKKQTIHSIGDKMFNYTIIDSQFGEDVARRVGNWRKPAKTIVRQKIAEFFC